MLTEAFQDKAVQYVCGAMTAAEAENFEVLLASSAELGALVAGLGEVSAAVAMSVVPEVLTPPVALKLRLLGAVEACPLPPGPEGLVVTDAAGRVEWVNQAFILMCGYPLEEIRGRKPGHLLQGPGTDPVAVARIRDAVRTRRECRETLVNYHKDGSRYEADIRIAPILDDAGEPLCFVARECKVSPGAGID